MRRFLVRQQHLVDPEAISPAAAEREKMCAVVLRRDLPQAALDQAAALSMVNTSFAVLSEQLDELAEAVQGLREKIEAGN